MFCDVNFMYVLYHDCARTLKRNLVGKLAIIELSGDFGFACNSSKPPCTLASFSHARMPHSARTHNVTCELYCNCLASQVIFCKHNLWLLYREYKCMHGFSYFSMSSYWSNQTTMCFTCHLSFYL